MDVVVAERPGVFVADDSVGVNDESFGDAVDAPVQSGGALRVGDGKDIGVGKFAQPLRGVGGVVFVVESDDGGAVAGEFDEDGVFGAARNAPRRPHIEQPCSPAQVGGRSGGFGVVQPRQGKLGRGFPDKRRGNGARVELQPDRQQNGERQKNQRRNNAPGHSGNYNLNYSSRRWSGGTRVK